MSTTTRAAELIKVRYGLEQVIYNALLLVAIIGPFYCLGWVIIRLWGTPLIRPIDVLLLIFTYFPIAAGVTIGLHRYFTHGSFKANTPLRMVLAVLALLAIEGPIIFWVATHRYHHKYSDTELDIHSPWRLKMKSLLGFFMAHIGWMFLGREADPEQFAPDLKNDRMIVWLDKLFPFWIFLSLALPALIGGLWEYSFGESHDFLWGALLGFIWGGAIRASLVHHATWCVNSIGHTFGSHPYRTTATDQSRNAPWWLFPLALLTMGELNHATHHAFPSSALQGTAWWNDPSYLIISVLEKCKLARKVLCPTPEQLAAKRI